MKKFLKITGWVLLSIILLVIGMAIFLQTPPGKRMVTRIAVDYLEKKFQTEVVIGSINYKIPSMVGLEKVIFLDKNSDTLLSMNHLEVDIQMLALLKNKLKIRKLELDGLYAKMQRNRNDTTFNYQFIIDAFASAHVDTLSKEEDTSASSMLYDIDKVLLKDITFIFDDEAGGTYFDIVLDSLLLRPKEIDPAQMVYRVEDLTIYKAQSVFRSFPAVLISPPDTSTEASPLVLEADKLNLIQSSYTMLTEPDSFYLDVNVGKLEARLDLFDLIRESIKLDGLNLVNTRAVITMGKPTGPIPPALPDAEGEDTTGGWYITGNKINLADIYFRMDDNSTARQRAGIDYAHLELSRLSMIVDDLLYSPDTISGDLTHLALEEQSGLELRELRTKFTYHDRGALLDELYVLTPNTLIQDRIEVKYPSLDAISKDIGSIFVDVNLAQSKAAINDILIFTPPDSRSSLLPYQGQHISIAGNIRGYLNDLSLNRINISGLNNTALALTGKIQGLPDPDKLYYDLDIENINSTFHDIRPFVPEGVSGSIHIPDRFAVKGKIKGSATRYQPDIYITTSEGNVRLQGLVDISMSGREQYNLDFAAEQLNLGKILRQDTLLGMVTMSGTATGAGFDPETLDASVQGDVQRFDFQGYAYRDVLLDARMKNQFAHLELHSGDPNASLDLVADVDLTKEHPAVVSNAVIRNVDLQALGFTGEQLVLGGTMDINFSDLNPDRPAGYMSWKDPILNYNGSIFDVDSIYVSSQPSEDSGQNIIAYIPDLINLSLTGNIPLTQIGNAALVHINEYFTLGDTLSSALNNYDMHLSLGINYHPTIQTFVPDLKPFDTIGLDVMMSPANFAVNAFAPKIVYGAHHIDNLVFKADDSNSSALEYALTLDKYGQEGGMQIYQPELKGYLSNDTLLSLISIKDAAGTENYALGLKAHTLEDIYYATLLPNLKLNYELWDISQNELAYYSDSGFYINNLNISKGSESIVIRSVTPSAFGSPLKIDIRNFELANISKILDPDTLLAEGQLNAAVDLDMSDTFPLFKGNLGIDRLSIYETQIGKLAARVSNQDANTYALDATITELDNDIHLSGLYHLEPLDGNNLDMNLDLGTLSLKRFEGLAFGSIKESDGYIKGDLKITGLTSAPKINGSLITQDLQTKLSMFNALYKMPSERILFENGLITFDNFRIIDSFGKTATITGNASTKDYTEFDLNLRFNADEWMAANSTKTDYENFYGRLILSSDLNIGGVATAPVIDGNIKLHDSTDFTYANIDEGPGLSVHDGIVKFVDNVDQYEFKDDSLSAQDIENQMTMNINVETEKYARFNVLVDPLTGDNASVFGTAFLNASMLPGGSFSLTGTYQIQGGYYELFIELIKKQFKIREGSTIQLAGDPMEAVINLEAVYDANIAPYDLMEKNRFPRGPGLL
ncbi:MAG: translocation/assembly module TamB domain-containing protein [Taibaiella sp.]|nr:translocation/assembly module TamB domain-containing protein [Taibaiella sp.]